MAKQPTPKVVTKKHLARMERERLQQRYLLIGSAVVLVLVLVIVLFGVLDQQVLQKNRPVARVGSTAISTGDFQTQVRFTRTQMINQLTYFMNDSLYSQFFGQYIQQLQGQLQAGNESQVGEQVLDQMIENQVILQEAQKMGITVSDAEIDKAIQEKFGYFPNGTSTPTITPTAAITSTMNPTQLALVPPTATPTETPEVTATSEVTPTVEGATPAATDADTTATPAEAATATPASDATATPAVSPTPENTATPFPTATAYTEEGFKKAYDEYFTGIKDTGYTSQAFRENVRAELLREKVLQEVTKDVQPVQEQVWARHILVTTEEEAKVVEERLKAGEDFATLAKEVSTDTSNKEQGGDLGWFTKDRMVEPFSEAAFKLAVGEISPPVQSTFGWHVIQGLGHEDRPLTADQFEQAKQTAFQTWMDAKKTELNVEKLERWSQVVPVDPALPEQLAQPVQSQPIPNIPQ